ncbi:alpha/beta hydrolase family protein [Millisia brevis]|uniref:alpha/beta hydrolase family protein n=1 Tax=Millisia brevis TaxID=264148 RepID=UPI000835E03D|nr:lipase family protein [Millisia brevis]
MSRRSRERRTANRRRAIALAAAVAVLAGCGTTSGSTDATGTAAPETAALPQLSADAVAGRGTLISSEPVWDIDPSITAAGASAYRVVYRSTSGVDGSATETSAMVLVPDAPAADGSRPVVSFAHGTTGVTPNCGPSLYPDLLGYAGAVAPLLTLNYVIVMPDYQGLGFTAPGDSAQHPYLEPITSGYNVIDAVRAARAVAPSAGERWAAYGVSQGGQAAWSAGELADSYGEGLDYVGAVALAPPAAMSEILPLAQAGFLSREQMVLWRMIIEGMHVAQPQIDPDDYLGGVLAEDRDAWFACTPGPDLTRRGELVNRVNPADARPVDDAAAEALREWLARISLPQRPAGGPMLVINGGQDRTVRPQWVQRAIDEACALGDTVAHIVRPDQGHADLDPGGETATWLEARFRGDPAPNTCQ